MPEETLKSNITEKNNNKDTDLTESKSNLPAEQEEKILVSDEMLLGVYGEILNNIRCDREQIDDYLTTFADMVINEGDSTTSSKEAMVNLLKEKASQSDKMAKIADLMTRIKLKEPNTWKPWMGSGAKGGSNTINIIDQGGNRRELLKAIKEAKQKKEANE